VPAVKIAVFDSGLGGLTVYQALRSRMPQAEYIYFADSAAFPYGGWQEEALVERLLDLFLHLIDTHHPDVCVLACNTASTIALAPLRVRFSTPFVGTVPAIKVAAERSKSRMFSVLATPGTVKRDYTFDLIRDFAADCEVALVGADGLAALAEQHMRGLRVDEKLLRTEIHPAFVEKDGRRVDTVVLGCTHFPLLTEHMQRCAPWQVEFIDPADAIAKRTETVLSSSKSAQSGDDIAFSSGKNLFLFSGDNSPDGRLAAYLQSVGLGVHMAI
jgi:glutamate racemase